ncbi:PREDICTED: FBD-associated F-box protein At5g56370-like [Tarenaya hassleriana]|uniref:FBD-associated F-box protein At5g56370-like n=1 Tax=Tarenaya hassleriana TaxID=28532 RepID=UPI0008FD1298|nr:PREDICTED: FBD-associated F-box protein At5g56370-like [Tarenaya hassleriana]
MDRISVLPDELLLRILSLVPMKDVVRTMILSKRWQSLWTMVPKLEYNCVGHKTEHEIFTEFVYRSLLLNRAPILEN